MPWGERHWRKAPEQAQGGQHSGFCVEGMNCGSVYPFVSLLSHKRSCSGARAPNGRKGSVWAGGIWSQLYHQPDVSLEVSQSVGLGQKEVEGARTPELFCVKRGR